MPFNPFHVIFPPQVLDDLWHTAELRRDVTLNDNHSMRLATVTSGRRDEPNLNNEDLLVKLSNRYDLAIENPHPHHVAGRGGDPNDLRECLAQGIDPAQHQGVNAGPLVVEFQEGVLNIPDEVPPGQYKHELYPNGPNRWLRLSPSPEGAVTVTVIERE